MKMIHISIDYLHFKEVEWTRLIAADIIRQVFEYQTVTFYINIQVHESRP